MNAEQGWVTLTVADNQPLADLMAARLREVDIPVVLEPGVASAYMGASSPTSLKVPQALLSKAQEVLGG